jgi:hypothetical protein
LTELRLLRGLFAPINVQYLHKVGMRNLDGRWPN